MTPTTDPLERLAARRPTHSLERAFYTDADVLDLDFRRTRTRSRACTARTSAD